jgi:hypothetical protein
MCYHAAALPTWAIYTLIARAFLIVYYTSWLVCLYNARGQFCHHSYVYVYIYIAACEGRKILMVLSPAYTLRYGRYNISYGSFACSHTALVQYKYTILRMVPQATLNKACVPVCVISRGRTSSDVEDRWR